MEVDTFSINIIIIFFLEYNFLGASQVYSG